MLLGLCRYAALRRQCKLCNEVNTRNISWSFTWNWYKLMKLKTDVSPISILISSPLLLYHSWHPHRVCTHIDSTSDQVRDFSTDHSWQRGLEDISKRNCMTMFIHLLCLCPLGLTIKLHLNISINCKMVSSSLQAPVISLSFDHFAVFVCSLPLLSFVSCVSIAIVWHFEEATWSHCKVSEFLNNLLREIHISFCFVLFRYILRVSALVFQ